MTPSRAVILLFAVAAIAVVSIHASNTATTYGTSETLPVHFTGRVINQGKVLFMAVPRVDTLEAFDNFLVECAKSFGIISPQMDLQLYTVKGLRLTSFRRFIEEPPKDDIDLILIKNVVERTDFLDYLGVPLERESELSIDLEQALDSFNKGKIPYKEGNYLEALPFFEDSWSKFSGHRDNLRKCLAPCSGLLGQAAAAYPNLIDLHDYSQYAYSKTSDDVKAAAHTLIYDRVYPAHEYMGKNVIHFQGKLDEPTFDKLKKDLDHHLAYTPLEVALVKGWDATSSNAVNNAAHEKALANVKKAQEAQWSAEMKLKHTRSQRRLNQQNLRDFLLPKDRSKLEFKVQLDSVDRRSNLSVKEFYEEYEMKKKPVIITDYLEKIVNAGTWDLDHIEKVCGDKTVWLARREMGSESWGGLKGGVYTQLTDWIQKVRNGTAESDLYLHDIPLISLCPDMLKSEFAMPKYFAADFLQRIDRRAAREDAYKVFVDAWPSLFIGAKSSNSHLHIDSFYSHFWMFLFSGEKHWRFFPHEERMFLSEEREKLHFATDALNPDLEKFPLLGLTHPFDANLRAGEMLFVPAGCPHQVYNNEDTVAISGNYVDSSNLEGSIEELENMNYWDYANEWKKPEFPKEVSWDQPDLSWSEYKNQIIPGHEDYYLHGDSHELKMKQEAQREQLEQAQAEL
eukprot:TRINITY_DN5198_c0_g1_i1.p1 TRINITY_DN5198_c0_g1~~TRINITY_DN5198_c0_g1_i1.p1  ORF type:complete len:708 (+),score=194.45 TRINITY_DN5198_c0_g1_i1:84-2126(+)